MIKSLKRDIRLQSLEIKGYFSSRNVSEIPMADSIDFVVTWVDGNDPAWREEKMKYDPAYKKGSSDARYREWNQFMYWFRAVEKYAPWVRYIHLITWGHLPPWLNVNHPKLKIVNHKDYIPEKYLPTFSSIPIELNMFRIPDLSEHFVYFCDDFYISRPLKPEDFFSGGLPKYPAIAQPTRNYRYNGPFAHQLFSNVGMINSLFDVCASIEKSPEKWFSKCYGRCRSYNKSAYKDTFLPGMIVTHLGVPYRKSTCEKVWNALEAEMDETCNHRFRTPLDLMHQLFSMWEIMEGTFSPVAADYYGKVFGHLSTQTDAVKRCFLSSECRMICLNDSVDITADNFAEVKELLDAIFQETFPQKSTFEL